MRKEDAVAASSFCLRMNTHFAFIAPASTLFRVLDGIADATNYLLLVWLLVVLVLGARRRTLCGRAWLAVALSIAIVYILKAFDGKFDLWERVGWNYSTHSALAAAVVISLWFLDAPRRAIALAVFVAYEVLMVLLGFHSILDIVSTLVVVAPLIWLCHFLRERKPISSPA